MNAGGREGRHVCDSIPSSYIRFISDLNDARTEGRDGRIMLRARFRLYRSIKTALGDGPATVRKANNEAWIAVQLGEDLNNEIAELSDAESVSKMFGFFLNFVGGWQLRQWVIETRPKTDH